MATKSDEELTADEAIKKAESNVDAAAEAAAKEAGDKAKKEGLSEEEVNKRIEAARKQEKDKLYSEITSLKTMVKELTDKAAAEENAKKEAEEAAQKAADEERRAKLSSEERLAEQMRALEDRLAREAAERARLEADLTRKDEEAQLERYRQQVINEAGDEVIPELIRGNSVEEIQRSAAYAKNRYQELFQSSTKKAEGNIRRNMPGPGGGDDDALMEQELQSAVDNLNIDVKRYHRDQNYKAEIDAKRDAALDRVSMAYRRSMGR